MQRMYEEAHARKIKADEALRQAQHEAMLAAEAVREADDVLVRHEKKEDSGLDAVANALCDSVSRLTAVATPMHEKVLQKFINDENQIVCAPGLRMSWKDFAEKHQNFCRVHKYPYRVLVRDDVGAPLSISAREDGLGWWVIGCDVAV